MGRIVLDEVEKGATYRIAQSTATGSYRADPDARTVSVTAHGRIGSDAQTHLNVTNRMLRVSLGVTDELSSVQVPGVSLALYNDADELITAMAGKSIPDIFAHEGEATFRDWETKALTELGKQSGLVIATGGGCVTQTRNYNILRQNGQIFWLQRDLALLPVDGRPLSQANTPEALYRTRKPMY